MSEAALDPSSPILRQVDSLLARGSVEQKRRNELIALLKDALFDALRPEHLKTSAIQLLERLADRTDQLARAT